jgi:flagellar basal-body rod protein FlgB
MTDGIEAVTTASLALALDAASLRQQAIAANIANANTPGYAPLRVSFEAQLDDARRALALDGRLDATALEGVQPSLETEAADAGLSPGVLIDVEVAEMAKNSVQYQALLKGLSSHFALLSAAVADGKK